MHFFGSLGIVSVIFGLSLEIYILCLKYFYLEPFSRHIAALLLGVLLIILGAQLFSLGLLGELITFKREQKIELPPEIYRHED